MKELYKEGIITRYSTREDVYSQITCHGELYYFNKHTKISGCSYKHLCEGDRVLIKEVSKGSRYQKIKRFVSSMDLVDITQKWNNILNKEGLNIDDIETRTSIILRKEVISAPNKTHERILKIQSKRASFKGMSKTVQNILDLYTKGYSVRDIGNKVKLPKSTCFYYIKKYIDSLNE
jgi:hypothetical protein